MASKPSFQHFITDDEIFSAFKNFSQEIQVNDKRGIYFLIPKEEKGKATGLDRFLFTNMEVSS